MKKIFIITLLFLISCSSDQEDVTVPDYMIEVFEENFDCSEIDFLDLTIDNQNVNYDYTLDSGNLLCVFEVGNTGGDMCEDCEGFYAPLSMPMDNYNSLFPNIPIHLGMMWEVNNVTVPITEINMKGLKMNINITESLIENIEIGSYHYSENLIEKGINLFFHWEVVYEDDTNHYEAGYTLDLDKNRAYSININCIDRSVENKIRLTGSFTGVFIGKEFFSYNNDTIYEVPVSGNFSYNISL